MPIDLALEANGLTRDDIRMRVGQSSATVGALMLNAGLPLSGVELYAFGGASYRTGAAAGFYRRPEQEERVDLTRYPNGFLPHIHPDIYDWSLALGGRTKAAGWDLDISASHGGNIFLFEIRNSVNASLDADGGAALGDVIYRLARSWSVSVGANSLLNTFPDEHKIEANRYSNQFRYRPDQFGMTGGFYSLRLQYLQ